MGIEIQAVVEVSPQVERAFRIFPEVVNREFRPAMEDSIKLVETAIKDQVRVEGLVRTGNLLQEIKGTLTGTSFSSLTGRVGIGRPGQSKGFYAKFHQRGAVIVPRKGPFLTFPIGDVVLIDQIGDRQLKRARREFLNMRWVKIKQVTIRRTEFFTKGVDRAMPAVDRRFGEAITKVLDEVDGRR